MAYLRVPPCSWFWRVLEHKMNASIQRHIFFLECTWCYIAFLSIPYIICNKINFYSLTHLYLIINNNQSKRALSISVSSCMDVFHLQMKLAVSTSEFLSRFRSGFTLIHMMWTVKNNFDADPLNLDRKALKRVVSIRL